ncbi:MAG: hypothetical protein V3V36_03835 [Candidatus Hydrothermarchaeaceae archaeon]
MTWDELESILVEEVRREIITELTYEELAEAIREACNYPTVTQTIVAQVQALINEGFGGN